jgi:hypothetical protein
MSDTKKTADELLFQQEEEKPVFRSMVAEGVILNDIIQKNKV